MLNSLLPTTVVEVETAAIVNQNYLVLLNVNTNKPSCMVEVVNPFFGEKRKEASSDK